MTTFPLNTSDQHALVAVPTVMMALASLCVGLRFRARKIQRAKLQMDDWLCLFTLVSMWGFQCVNIAMVFNAGAGLDIEKAMMRDPSVMTLLLKLLLANFTLWIVIVTLVQLCVMLFLLRIFGTSTVFRSLAWALILAITGLGIAGFFMQIFQCKPIHKAWMPMEPGACINADASCKSVGLLHVILDLCMVLLPMPTIWSLKTAVRNKVIINVLLALGLLATIMSLLKLDCVIATKIPKQNLTKYITFPLLMQTIELPIGLICCCVPSLKPAMKEIRLVYVSAARRLASFTGISDGGKTSGMFTSNPQTNESTKNFMPLHDGTSDNGSMKYGNRTRAHGNDIELMTTDVEGDATKDIHLVHSYSVRR
ncbi:hypothetical protein K458DRAFT_324150 [Lentithecium fluviatile CBS 122367]|uniref:Rhodopsin domain-containing protein n=1 Tax=Lentithecium fluviatile CBS 122367 TaxID=1168545 RepID=A0A6G1ICL2_9PLEO|nr:hypothetical protein K458DRAFT_324150 [Lentithecium fluviatile CBS 122367]